MADGQDGWGYLIFVFFIILIVIFVIKIFIQFPGLLEWKIVFSDDDDTISDDLDIERNDIIDTKIGQNMKHKMHTEVKTITTNVHETDKKANVENAETYSQSTADRHAFFSNFMLA